MVQLAVDFQYFGLAVTAGTAAAQVGHLVAGLFGGFEQRLVGRHFDGHALAGQGDAERLAVGALLDKALVVDMAVGPAQGVGAVEGVVDHAVRAADIHMAAQRTCAEDLADVHARLLTLHVQVHAVAVARLQLQAQCTVFRPAYRQVQFEIGLLDVQLFHL
ncbi:hypothetical protein D3C77_525620 [compost metagenome]